MCVVLSSIVQDVDTLSDTRLGAHHTQMHDATLRVTLSVGQITHAYKLATESERSGYGPAEPFQRLLEA